MEGRPRLSVGFRLLLDLRDLHRCVRVNRDSDIVGDLLGNRVRLREDVLVPEGVDEPLGAGVGRVGTAVGGDAEALQPLVVRAAGIRIARVGSGLAGGGAVR